MATNKQTILIQGSGSVLGCALTHRLCDKVKGNANFCIRAGFSDLKEPTCGTCQNICECVQLDLNQKNMLQDALKNVTKLCIIPPYRENRVALVNSFVDLAYSMGIKKMVLVSVIGVNAEEVTFQKNLKAIENHITNKGDIVYTFLRFPAYMDNFLHLANDIKKGSLRLPTGDGKWPALWAEDAAELMCEVLLRDLLRNQAVDITGPEALAGRDIARTFSEVIGKQVNFISISGEEWKKEVIGLGMNEWKAEGLLELYRWYAAGRGERVLNEFSRLMNKPPHTLTDFIQSNLNTFRVSQVTPQ